MIVLTPKVSGTEYAIDLHGDLAGILTVAAGKQQKISDYDPLLQQVKMMTESVDQKNGWQNDSCADEKPSHGFSSEGNATIDKGACQPCISGLAENQQEDWILKQDKLVAGAGFEPTTFGL